MSAAFAERSRGTSRIAVATFLAPALLIYAGFTFYPVLRTFYNSVRLLKGRNVEEFVGLRNFLEILGQDPVFWKAVSNTASFTIVGTIADVLGGLLLALCLFSGNSLSRAMRVIWFTPVLMSYVVVGIIWVWLYDYDWGLINVILRWLGLGSFEQSWLGDPHTALWAVLVTHLWKWLGFNMIVCLAALHALPGDVLGAADLDNCSWLAKLVCIIIPMLRPTLVNLLVLSFVGKMMLFDLVWDHDWRRSAMVDRDRLDLCLQACLRLEHLRPRLSLRHCRSVVSDDRAFCVSDDQAAAQP